MRFDEFAARILSIYAAPIEERAEQYAHLFAALSADELPFAIYLFQGRFGPPSGVLYRNQNWPSVQNLTISVDYASRKIPTSPKRELSIRDVYRELQSVVSYGEITNLIPDYANKLASLIADLSIDGRIAIYRFLAGKPEKDKVLIRAFAHLASAGLDGDKSLLAFYHTTLPDLGRLALTLRLHHYLDVIFMPPQIGTIVPREEMSTWNSIEEAWNAIKPYTGLYIQGKFFDGYHIQAHRSEHQVLLLTLQGQDITTSYPRICEQLEAICNVHDLIVDGELVGFDTHTKSILPLHAVSSAADHIFAVFDIQLQDGADCRSLPYVKRREKLARLFSVVDFSRPGIFLMQEHLVHNLDTARRVVRDFLAHPFYEGVVVKDPQSKLLSGRNNPLRGRVKGYTVLDALLIGIQGEFKSYQVGLWADENRDKIIPFRNVETITSDVIAPLKSECLRRRIDKRPSWIGAGPASDWYLASPIVVAVKWDGIVVPNRGERYTDVELIPHEGVTIVGFYTLPKAANTIKRLESLKKAPY